MSTLDKLKQAVKAKADMSMVAPIKSKPHPYLDKQAELIGLAEGDPDRFMGEIDKLVREAYIAGVNNLEGGKEYNGREIETIGDISMFADSWCKVKGTRP